MDRQRGFYPQKLWGNRVVAHLFLAGLAAGTYMVSSLLNFFYTDKGLAYVARIAVGSVIPLLLVGLILLFSHLGRTANAGRALSKPGSSWLARGSIALLAFLVLDLIQCFLWIWPATILAELPGWNAVLQVINSLIALFILLYSAMILTDLKTFPFWRTWALPVLFVASGLTSGLMFLILMGLILGGLADNVITTLISWNSVLVLILAMALVAFLWRGKAETSVTNSINIMTVIHRQTFYLGLVICGMIVPFLLSIYIVYSNSSRDTVFVLALTLTMLGLTGGYILKLLVLKSGTSANLKLRGETVPLPEIARIPASKRVKYH